MVLIIWGRRIGPFVGSLLSALVILAALSGAAFGGSSSYTALFESNGYLKRGDRGEEVRWLQELLSELGFYNAGIDGIFGDKTRVAVLEFQKKAGLGQDGIVGPGTKKALESQQLKLNPPEKHIVAQGETLSVIAEKYGMSASYLVKINQIKNPDRIFPGDTLILKAQEKPVEPDEKPSDIPIEVPLPPPVEPLPIPDKRICLTFNDGPDPVTTPQILARLDEYGIKATFFVIGEKARKHPDLVKDIADRGHVIGVHGYEHKVLAGLSSRQVYSDLQLAQKSVIDSSGQIPYLYRPPGGALDEIQMREASKLGMTVLMWTNIGGADLGARSAEEVSERVLKSARDGSIILLHEGLVNSAEALAQIIPSLARMGFGFQNLEPASVTGPGQGQ
ncbi:MAG: polysaccharide deacetylase family protein [Bacillota bacterium]